MKLRSDLFHTACFTALLALGFASSDLAFGQALPWQTGQPQTPAATQPPGVTSVSGVPLFIDGTQSKTPPAPLAPALLDQVKSVTTLGDALHLLGPAYVAPDDTMHIAHWHFTNGAMLTLWPQGGEALSDKVSVYPRPDCGMPADQCTDMVLGRKSSQQQKHSGGSKSGGSSSGGLQSLMKMLPGR